MKLIAKTILSLCFAALIALPALAGDGVHKLVLQISDDDPQKMNTVLNVAANVARHYSEMGDEVAEGPVLERILLRAEEVRAAAAV